jgi:hypothetical protein
MAALPALEKPFLQDGLPEQDPNPEKHSSLLRLGLKAICLSLPLIMLAALVGWSLPQISGLPKPQPEAGVFEVNTLTSASHDYLVCPATCASGNPQFPCGYPAAYPVRFQAPLQIGSFFSWQAATYSSSLELGFAQVLSKIYLRFDPLMDTKNGRRLKWTASFYGANRFWSAADESSKTVDFALMHPASLTPSGGQLTQCACYFVAGETDSDKINFDQAEFMQSAQAAASSKLSHLMQSHPFQWSNYLVGQPAGGWGELDFRSSLEEKCRPFSKGCLPVMGATNETAAAHFGGAPPWVEHYNSGCADNQKLVAQSLGTKASQQRP